MVPYIFAVDEKPWCVWDPGLEEENDRFLRNMSANYFAFLADQYLARLDSPEDEANAAIALRASYHHGLEAMFGLLGAFVQAPGAVIAWLPKCSNQTLRTLVARVSDEGTLLTQAGRQRVSWKVLARTIHRCAFTEDEPQWATADRYAKLWSRLARAFVDEKYTWEYNSLKHGLRVTGGTFTLKRGREHQFGVAPPDDEMVTLGISKFGNLFMMIEPLCAGDGAPDSSHVRLRRQRVNWNPVAMGQALRLVSMSIQNILSALRIANGEEPETLRFDRPGDPAFFEAPWLHSPSGPSFNSAPTYHEDVLAQIALIRTQDLLLELEKRTPRNEE